MNIAHKRLARIIANSNNNTYVRIIDGNKFPELLGEASHYETKGGSYITSPYQYSKYGWSNMRYVPSTIRVEVGKKWLDKNEKAVRICECPSVWRFATKRVRETVK